MWTPAGCLSVEVPGGMYYLNFLFPFDFVKSVGNWVVCGVKVTSSINIANLLLLRVQKVHPEKHLVLFCERLCRKSFFYRI